MKLFCFNMFYGNSVQKKQEFNIVGIFGNFTKIRTTFELYIFLDFWLTFSGGNSNISLVVSR